MIIAEFCVDDSEGYTGYYKHRDVCKVAIGYSKGIRENFKQLRKAAVKFEPTAHLDEEN